MTQIEKVKNINYVSRFDIHQRLQHLLLFLSMFILFLTGFPIKYGDTSWAKFSVSLFNGFENMFNVHLIAGVAMIASGFYHILWLIISFRKSGSPWSILPGKKDVLDAFNHAKFLLGLKKERPKYARYNYLEKFEYYCVIYGILLMGISGIILWFPQFATAILPLWVIDMFRIAHSNEALVAMFAVVLGHFFWVHLNPDVFH